MDPTTYSTIDIEARPDGVAIAALNRPDRLNAVDATLHLELVRLLREVDCDDAVTALVVTGRGRAFCAGGDMSGEDPTRALFGSTWREARQIVDGFLECQTPIISAVNGHAMGLGATIALLADVVFAGRSAVFADTHVKMAVGAGDGGQLIWPLLMGVNRAKYFLMTGEKLTAEQAEEYGLVNFVVDDDELLDRALALASHFASGPVRAISASKTALNNYLRVVSAMIMPLSLAYENMTMRTADFDEAVAAFREKRPPRFTGG